MKFDIDRSDMTSAKRIGGDTIAPVAAPTTGTITGVVFNDKDGDGIQDAGELGLAGRLVYIDSNKDGIREAGERTVKTDANGNYTIGSVAPGEYYVAAQESGGYVGTTPDTQKTSYSWDDYTYKFVEIVNTGTRMVLNNRDDGSTFLESSLPISFHGDRIDINISTNGFITFGSADQISTFNNPNLPTFTGPSNIVAPLWDDFTFVSGGGIYTLDTEDAVIIEWRNAKRYGDASGQVSTFEAIIHHDGTIEFQYQTVADAVNATVGVQIEHGIESTQIGGNTANPANKSAYIFTPSNSFESGVAIVDVTAGNTSSVTFGLTKPTQLNLAAAAMHASADLAGAHHPVMMHDLHVALV